MGKKSSNKKPSAADGELAPPSNPKGGEMLVDPEARVDWKDELTEAERAHEEAKQKVREQKAAESAKKQAKENEAREYWEKEAKKQLRSKEKVEKKDEAKLNKAKLRAEKEGVLTAEDWGDGKWWVLMDAKTKAWKEVQGEYYCTYCEKHLNYNSLEDHLETTKHKNKVGWELDPSGGSSAGAAGAASSQSAPQQASSRQAGGACSACEDWQELTKDGYLLCKPCGKVIDENHLAKEDHQNRLWQWTEAQGLKQAGYPPPAIPYLAYTPDEADPNGERALKCLLCNKWVYDDATHLGTMQAPAGTKEHQKNLRNYANPKDAWYQENVIKVRNKWHAPKAMAFTPARTMPTPKASAWGPTPGAARTVGAPVASAWGPNVGAAASSSAAPVASAWGPTPGASAAAAAAAVVVEEEFEC